MNAMTFLAATLIVRAVTAQASFDPNLSRYLTPFDLLLTQKRLFPSASVPQRCQELDASNRAVSGDSQPGTGSPAIAQPSGGFIRWYAGCLGEYVSTAAAHARKGSKAERRYLFGSKVGAWLEEGRGAAWSTPWKRLGEKERLGFLSYQIERMIGPESVLADFGLCKTEAKMAQLIEATFSPSETVFSGLKKAMYFLGLRDEFLSY